MHNIKKNLDKDIFSKKRANPLCQSLDIFLFPKPAPVMSLVARRSSYEENPLQIKNYYRHSNLGSTAESGWWDPASDL